MSILTRNMTTDMARLIGDLHRISICKILDSEFPLSVEALFISCHDVFSWQNIIIVLIYYSLPMYYVVNRIYYYKKLYYRICSYKIIPL